MIRPRLVVSRCLEFDSCRFDGSVIPNSVIAALKPYVDFITLCPEVEIGLGTPRPAVRLVQTPNGTRLLQPSAGRDLTEAMQAYAQIVLDLLPPVDGFILKNRSPSCGIRDAKIYASIYASTDKDAAVGKGTGLFAQAVLEKFPDLPVESEGRLTNRAIREHFFTAVFALARLRQVAEAGRMALLVEFHARSKLMLMAYNQTRMRSLGRLVANLEKRPPAEVMAEYVQGFRATLSRPPRRPSVVNALLHALGYFSKNLSRSERTFFLDLIQSYRDGHVPASAPISVVRSWIVRFGQSYLAQQTLFSPFPEKLALAPDSE